MIEGGGPNKDDGLARKQGGDRSTEGRHWFRCFTSAAAALTVVGVEIMRDNGR
jgi:hypothetical protein